MGRQVLNRSYSTASLRQDELWNLFQTPDFSVHDFLDNHITSAATYEDASSPLPVDPRIFAAGHKKTKRVQHTSFADVRCRSGCGYRVNDVKTKISELFGTCQRIKFKAERYHKNGITELTHADASTKDSLQGFVKVVQRDLSLVHDITENYANVAKDFGTLTGNLSGMTIGRNRLKRVHKISAHFSELNRELLGLTYSDLTQERDTAEKYQSVAALVSELQKVSRDIEAHNDGCYALARERMDVLYEEVEIDLVTLFRRAHEQGDMALIRQMADALSGFEDGSIRMVADFVDVTITQYCERECSPFELVQIVIDETSGIVHQLFQNGDFFMARFMDGVAQRILSPYFTKLLSIPASIEGKEVYLNRLHALYVQATQISEQLFVRHNYSIANTIRLSFGIHAKDYVKNELEFNEMRCAELIRGYYENYSKRMQLGKLPELRVLSEDGMNELDIGLVTLFQTIPSLFRDYYARETHQFVEEMAINHVLIFDVLKELKNSADRAVDVCGSIEIGKCLFALGTTCVRFVLLIVVVYGLEMYDGLLPPRNPKCPPRLTFFHLVKLAVLARYYCTHQINVSLKTLEQSETDSRLLRELTEYAGARIDKKLVDGLEQTLTSAFMWIADLLTGQSKSEYSHPSEKHVHSSPTAEAVIEYLAKIVQNIVANLDGKNRQNIALEAGTRFHCELMDHIQAWHFTENEAMILSCDIKEYKDCLLPLKNDVVNKVFDETLLLTKVLITRSENLSELLDDIADGVEDLDALDLFISLRSDLKPLIKV